MPINRRSLLIGGAVAFAFTRPASAALRCTPFSNQGVQLCEAGLDQNVGAVQAQQEHSQWCWAACISALFHYYGYDVPQARIVTATFGQLVNAPAVGPQIAAATNRNWVDDRGRQFAARCEVLWDPGLHVAQPDAAAQSALELAQGHPLIIGAGGHAMVLTAMSFARDAQGNGQPTMAIVRDPWPGRGRRQLAPQEWMATQFLAKVHVTGGGASGGGKPQEPGK
jgi:hypothetical protein